MIKHSLGLFAYFFSFQKDESGKIDVVHGIYFQPFAGGKRKPKAKGRHHLSMAHKLTAYQQQMLSQQ